MQVTATLDEFIARERLPEAFRRQAEHWWLPLAADVARRVRDGNVRILGISGSQGSGKSTLAGLLQTMLQRHFQLSAVNLSIDDFYLTRDQRRELAERVHPLFVTRGVPGTHDIGLAWDTIKRLTTASGPVLIPRFDKARDDRRPAGEWTTVEAPVDLIIIEGWCLHIPPQTPVELTAPVNTLEAEEDSRGIWREYVNRMLAQTYPRLFALIDYLAFLRAPDFDTVRRWRALQEQKLAQGSNAGAGHRIMNDDALNRFMQHYERLTRHALNTVGAAADVEFTLATDQAVVARKDKTDRDEHND